MLSFTTPICRKKRRLNNISRKREAIFVAAKIVHLQQNSSHFFTSFEFDSEKSPSSEPFAYRYFSRSLQASDFSRNLLESHFLLNLPDATNHLSNLPDLVENT